MSDSDNTLAKSFEPQDVEAHWGPEWERRGYARPTFDDAREDFSIQLPPPNVTGTLHMGHAFNQTIMDGLTRYHRMKGANTLWVPGTDHAGIATQIVVERQLDALEATRGGLRGPVGGHQHAQQFDGRRPDDGAGQTGGAAHDALHPVHARSGL